MSQFFAELKNCSMRIQCGFMVMGLLIVVLTVITLALISYISGENARIQYRIDEYIESVEHES